MKRTSLTKLVLHPIGHVDSELLTHLQDELSERFFVETAIGEPISIPAEAYSPQRRQYDSTQLLEEMSDRFRRDPHIHLGITPVDLYKGGRSYAFGEASTAQQVCIVSTARLSPSSRVDAETNHLTSPRQLLLERALKEAVHEVGHVYGLSHCSFPQCAMWYSNALEGVDRKTADLCQDHAMQIDLRRKEFRRPGYYELSI